MAIFSYYLKLLTLLKVNLIKLCCRKVQPLSKELVMNLFDDYSKRCNWTVTMFQVKASDNGSPSRSSTSRVTFHTLHKQHTLKQLPSLQRISVQIQENITPGTSVITLNASVHDKSQLYYVISGKLKLPVWTFFYV